MKESVYEFNLFSIYKKKNEKIFLQEKFQKPFLSQNIFSKSQKKKYHTKNLRNIKREIAKIDSLINLRSDFI